MVYLIHVEKYFYMTNNIHSTLKKYLLLIETELNFT